jgi:crotonobetainyl-CoA:carnitine CoA-transferase CaiB-like acyl-CoA transferase
VAQADTALVQLGTQLVAEALSPGSVVASGNSDPYCAPSGVYACAGDDEWCVVTVVDDAQWRSLCAVVDRPELLDDERFSTVAQRIRHRSEADDVVVEWTCTRDPQQAADALQAAGVPAGPMLRLPQLLTDPQLTSRENYTLVRHDLLSAALPATARAARFEEIADPPMRPAPLPGQHTREICAELLGMSGTQIDALVRDGILQPSADDPALAATSAENLR